MVSRANGTRANGHRANENRADVVVPSETQLGFIPRRKNFLTHDLTTEILKL